MSKDIPVSFEFFPPKDGAAQERLIQTAVALDRHAPDFMSVTYGAGGADRSRTGATVERLSELVTAPLMPHLTCVAHTEAEIGSALKRYQDMGIDHLLALAGDKPKDGQDYSSDYYHAEELVIAARSLGSFQIGVAAHPEGHPSSPSLESDRRFLAHKLSLADFAITQFFFRSSDYERLVDDLDRLAVSKPVIPGVLPISNVDGLYRIAQLNNTSIPTLLSEKLEDARGNEAEIEKIGVEVATELSDKLLSAGAPGIHLYTMNKAGLADQVLHNLGK